MRQRIELIDLLETINNGNDALIEWYGLNEENRLNITRHHIFNQNFCELLFLDTDFSSSRFFGCNFERSTFVNCNFKKSNFNNCNFNNTTFKNTINVDELSITMTTFNGANLSNQDFKNASLRNNDFSYCNLVNTNLHHCDLWKCNFYKAILGSTIFSGCKNLNFTSNLDKTILVSSPIEYESNKYNKFDIIFNWETIRIFGKLPLFGASYIAILLIPILFSAIKYTNNYIQLVINFFQKYHFDSNHQLKLFIDQHLIDKIVVIPYPYFPMLILTSSILLAIASTAYNLFCPSRIKEFSHDTWIDQLKMEDIHYYPVTLKNRFMIYISLSSYVFGAALALFVIIYNIIKIIIYVNS